MPPTNTHPTALEPRFSRFTRPAALARGWRCFVLALSGTIACDRPGPPAAPPALPVEELTLSDSLRREWIRAQDSTTLAMRAAATLRVGPLPVRRPLVIAFAPPPEWNGAVMRMEEPAAAAGFRADSAALRGAAEAAGFAYVERYGPEFVVQDPLYNNAYRIAVAEDSVGVVLLAPGAPPLKIHGRVGTGLLRDALEAYARRLGRRPASLPTI